MSVVCLRWCLHPECRVRAQMAPKRKAGGPPSGRGGGAGRAGSGPSKRAKTAASSSSASQPRAQRKQKQREEDDLLIYEKDDQVKSCARCVQLSVRCAAAHRLLMCACEQKGLFDASGISMTAGGGDGEDEHTEEFAFGEDNSRRRTASSAAAAEEDEEEADSETVEDKKLRLAKQMLARLKEVTAFSFLMPLPPLTSYKQTPLQPTEQASESVCDI
jgi:hypothetical protein